MSFQFHSKVFLIAGRSIQAHSPEGQDLVDYSGFSFVLHDKAKNAFEGSFYLLTSKPLKYTDLSPCKIKTCLFFSFESQVAIHSRIS